MTQKTVAIIGAGPAGLATARALRDAGFAISVFERNAGVGGIWDIDAPGSPMYETAHFISSHGLPTSHFSDHPFPEGTPAYPSQRQVQNYLQKFAESEGLLASVRFNCAVENATPVENHRWRIDVEGRSEIFDALAICTGTLWDAVMPMFEGEFTGTVRHSQTYRDPKEFTGKRVLVVGCGNSGVDIASDAARSANATFLSMRRGYWFLPKFIMGRPTDEFFRDKNAMPAWLSPPDLGAFLETVSGNPEQFGLPKPDHAPLASHPIMNNEVLQHIGHGRIQPRDAIARLDGDKVRFADGTVDQIDEIICATGYRASVSFLDDDLLNYHGGSRPQLQLTAFHPDHPTLFFNGMIETNGGVFGLFDRLGQIIASVLRKRFDEAGDQANVDKLIAAGDELASTTGKVGSPRHVGYVDTANLIAAMDHMQSALNNQNPRMDAIR